MTIRVFCRAPVIVGYDGSPVDNFHIVVPYDVAQSDGGESNGPKNFQDEAQVHIPTGVTLMNVANEVFDAVVAKCAENSFDEPVIGDVLFGQMNDFIPLKPTF